MDQVAGTSPGLPTGFENAGAKPLAPKQARRNPQRPAKLLRSRFLRRARATLNLTLSLGTAMAIVALLIWQLAELLSYFG